MDLDGQYNYINVIYFFETASKLNGVSDYDGSRQRLISHVDIV